MIAEKLFHSFDTEKQREIDSRWATEAELRINAYDSGKLPSRSFKSVFGQINQKGRYFMKDEIRTHLHDILIFTVMTQ